jgi:hypothetical protein
MGNIQLRMGDMFDGPSDMIVLPCSTAGTVTPFVQEKLRFYNISSRPNFNTELGSLSVYPFSGGENISQYIAFAVSVRDNYSSRRAIENIGRQLGEYTIKLPSVRSISAPLLGAGAGGLESETVVESLVSGFRNASHNDATLIINVLHQPVFQRISSKRDSENKLAHFQHAEERVISAIPPRVFISYSHNGPEHRQWVISLGDFLRKNGVNARLDAWHLRNGMDLPQFMTNELSQADRVIIISDNKYAQKSNGRVGGVGWETMIVQGDMAQLPPDSTKYMVVVRSQTFEAGMPIYLRTKFALHWPLEADEKSNQQNILREIFNAIHEPPIGKRPTYL